MPQQLETRADRRRDERRRRRAPRVHAATVSLAAFTAAALTATTAVPAAVPAPRETAASAEVPEPVTVADGTAVEVEGSTGPVAVVESAVAQASTALLAAQNVAMEGVDATTEQAQTINRTTAVVRELVRRAAEEADVEVPAVAAAAAPVEDDDAATSSPAAEEGPAFDPAAVPTTPTVVQDGDAVAVDLTLTTPTTEVASAADAAVEAAAAEVATTTGDDEGTPAAVIVAAAIEQQTATLAELVAAPVTPVSVDPAPSPEEIAAEQAKAAEEAARAEAQRVAELSAAAATYGNGQIPENLLQGLSWDNHAIRPDAATALERVNAAFAATFGVNLQINDGYRSYSDQVATKASRGYWAATPGYSNHGLAVAVDIGGLAYGNAMYEWMAANAGAYGWVNPDWAKQGGRKPEPWHWEFTG